MNNDFSFQSIQLLQQEQNDEARLQAIPVSEEEIMDSEYDEF